jgi:2-polyprenyl-3-methyl-5-hydroxy-6-metoxy-1,4-benzoquinol methylase
MSDALRAEAASMRWFHALDLGGFQTSGRFPPGTPQNITLYPVMDLLQHVEFEGLDCLDVGTAHGLSAFGMKLRGARTVTATDVMDVRSPPWELARRALDLEVDYLPDTTFENIYSRMPGRKFDLIVCAGVIYHMFNPFDAVLKCRRLLKPNGILVLESAYLPNEQRSILDFNADSVALKEVYTYWMPSGPAMAGMLRLAGLDPLADRSVRKPDRLAIIARNVAWENVRERSDLCVRMHEAGLYATDAIREPEGEPSPAQYSGPTDSVVLDWRSYIPNWAPHPVEMRDVVGKTTWRSTQRNY